MISEEMKKMLVYYNKGLELYKCQKWDEAIEQFKKALEIIPDDGPSKLYIERCEGYKKNPPGSDWDGVCTFTTK